jgi:hypothetical protein
MKVYGGVGTTASLFFTSALDGGERTASRPGSFTIRESSPGIHWRGDWVSPRTLLYALKVPLITISSNYSKQCLHIYHSGNYYLKVAMGVC